MATFNIRVKVDTTGVRQELREVQNALTRVEQRTTRNIRRSATAINAASAALTKFTANAVQRSNTVTNSLRVITERLKFMEGQIIRITPRLQLLLSGGQSTGRGAAQARDLAAAVGNLSRVVASSERRIARLEVQMQKSRASSAEASANIRILNTRLREMGRTAATGGARTERALRRVQQRTTATQLSASRLATTIRLLFGSFAGGLGVISTGRLLAGFEQSLSTVLAITKATETQMVRLRNEAKRLGAVTRFSAEQAAQGMVFLARSGLDAEQAFASIEPTLRLAQAGAIDLARAAEISTNIMIAFGLSVRDLPRVIDVMAATATSANTDISQLGEAMKFVGPVATALGVDVETASAAIAVLSNSGLQASLAGTGLRQVLLKLVRQTGPARKALQSLGLSARDVDVRAHGLIQVLENFRAQAINAGEAAAFFENRGGTAFLALINGLESLKAYDAALRQAAGASEEMARIMDDNLNGAFLRLKSAAQAVVLELGDAGATSGLRATVELLAAGFRKAAAGAEVLLDILIILSTFWLVRFAKAILSGLAAVGRFLAGTNRIGRTNKIVAGIAATTAAIGTMADETVIARKEFEDLGTVDIQLGDVFDGIWAYIREGLGSLVTDLLETITSLPGRIRAAFARAGDRADESPEELLARLEREQREFAQRIADQQRRQEAGFGEEDRGLIGTIQGTARARREAELTEQYLQGLVRWRGAHTAAQLKDAKAAEALAQSYGRINQQATATAVSLINENKLLRANESDRRRLQRLQAAEAQSGLDFRQSASEIQVLTKSSASLNEEQRKLLDFLNKLPPAQRKVEEARIRDNAHIAQQIIGLVNQGEAQRVVNDINSAFAEINAEIIAERAKTLDLSTRQAILYGQEATALADVVRVKGDERDAFIESYEARKRELDLLATETRIFNEIRGPQETYQRNLKALNSLRAQGRITAEEYNRHLKVLQERLISAVPELQKLRREFERLGQLLAEGNFSDILGMVNAETGPFQGLGLGTFSTGFLEEIAKVTEGLRSFAVEAGAIFGRIAANLSNTVGAEIFNALHGTQTWNEALGQIGLTIQRELIQAFVKLGIQLALNALLGQTIVNATTGALAAAVAASWAPAAAAASLATAGANAGPAAGALTSTAALAQSLFAGAAAFQDGGYVRGPGGPRDDRIMARLSRGEFVMNARATRENRRDLEAMNNGRRRSGVSIENLNVNVEGVTDVDSFNRSRRQIEEGMSRSLRTAVERM